jgi:hypothetical protein
MSAISNSALPLPLSLRSSGRESTISQAQGFATTLLPTARLAVTIDKITADVFAAFASAQTSQGRGPAPTPADQVALRAPDMARVQAGMGESTRSLSSEGMLAMLLGRLQQQLSRNDLEDLKQRQQHFQAQQAGRVIAGESLSAALQAALAAEAAARAAMEGAIGEAESVLAAAEMAREEAARLQAELEALLPDSPEYPAKAAQLAAAQARAADLDAAYQQAAQQTLVAGQALNAALQELEQQRGRVDQFNAGMPTILVPPRESSSGTGKLHELIARLSQLMSEASLNKLESESEALLKQLEAREKQNMERARKHEEEQQRARDAEKKTGCVGKVFGWMGAVVGAVVGAVMIGLGAVTCNPALIAGGVLAMALSIDAMVGLAKDEPSLMAKLTAEVAKVVTAVLVECGVPEEKAKMIGHIIATIVVTAVVIVITMGLGSAAASAAKVSEVVKAIQQVMQLLQLVAQGLGAIGTITQGVGQIIVAGIQVDLAKLLAAMQTSMTDSEMLRDMLGKLSDAVAQMDKTALDLLKQMADVQSEETATTKTIIGHIRNTA